MFQCRKCGVEKATSEFSPNKWTSTGHTLKCKACCSEYQKQWNRRNPEKTREQGKRKHAKWRESNPYKWPVRTTDEGRYCSSCKTRKAPDEFGKSTTVSDGISQRCKACSREISLRHRYKDVELSRAKERAKGKIKYERHREKLKEQSRRTRLAYEYNFSDAGRLAMLEAQNHSCAICKALITLPDGKKSNRDAQIDHCHETGEIRGLLCPPCNKGLGHFRDNPKLLLSAAAYLSP